MKHSLIWLVCAGLLMGLSALYADDYVDDVYYRSQKMKAEKAKPVQPASATQTPAKVVTPTTTTTTTTVQPATVSTQTATTTATAVPKVQFTQVSDTVVKAVIRR